MKHTFALKEQKVVNERAVPRDGLCADTSFFGKQIIEAETWTIFLAFSR